MKIILFFLSIGQTISISIAKVIVTSMICKHPDLSEAKVIAITNMMIDTKNS